ncbi:MAG TPA: hypothetical protein VL860_06025, partial [Planctomycetota bacterium]|nr:hypothetical protein [Planctomycetota bacterium]
MTHDGYDPMLERARPAATVAPATVCLVLGFIAATAGVLLASSLPTWVVWAAWLLAAVCTLIAAYWRASAILGAFALALALFGWAQWTEQSRQAANFAVSERIFREALPPFDTVGAVPDPADTWLTERDLPRLRIARIQGVVLQ